MNELKIELKSLASIILLLLSSSAFATTPYDGTWIGKTTLKKNGKVLCSPDPNDSGEWNMNPYPDTTVEFKPVSHGCLSVSDPGVCEYIKISDSCMLWFGLNAEYLANIADGQSNWDTVHFWIGNSFSNVEEFNFQIMSDGSAQYHLNSKFPDSGLGDDVYEQTAVFYKK